MHNAIQEPSGSQTDYTYTVYVMSHQSSVIGQICDHTSPSRPVAALRAAPRRMFASGLAPLGPRHPSAGASHPCNYVRRATRASPHLTAKECGETIACSARPRSETRRRSRSHVRSSRCVEHELRGLCRMSNASTVSAASSTRITRRSRHSTALQIY